MTARIQRNFTFTSGVHFNNQFYTNCYDLDITFMVESELIHDQNTAMDRIKYYITECLDSSTFINQSDTVAVDNYSSAGMRVCTLPEEPYDQIVGIMLMTKLNAISEGRLTIMDLSIESYMSDGVSCLHSAEENTGPFMLKGWWNSTQPDTNEIKAKNRKVVKLKKNKNDWDELGLGFTKVDDLSTFDSENIVFASFDQKTEE